MSLTIKLKRYVQEAYRCDHFPSTWNALTSEKPKLAYFGFLGDKNLGDEMVYWGARKLFHNCVLIPVKRRSPAGILLATQNPSKFFDGIVQGGGTLINHKSWAPDRDNLFNSGLPIFVHGSGVLNEKPNSQWSVLQRNTYGGLRGPRSGSWLSKTASLPTIGDAAFALDIRSQRCQNPGRVLINLGTHKHNDLGHLQAIEDTLVQFADRVVESGLEPAFLPFHQIDWMIGQRMHQRNSAIALLDQPTSVDEINQQFADAAFAVGERLHFVIAAALSHCPFLSINYASKHVDFLSSVNLEENGVSPDQFDLERVTAAFEERTSSLDKEPAFSRFDEFRQLQRSQATKFLERVSQGILSASS